MPARAREDGEGGSEEEETRRSGQPATAGMLPPDSSDEEEEDRGSDDLKALGDEQREHTKESKQNNDNENGISKELGKTEDEMNKEVRPLRFSFS